MHCWLQLLQGWCTAWPGSKWTLLAQPWYSLNSHLSWVQLLAALSQTQCTRV